MRLLKRTLNMKAMRRDNISPKEIPLAWQNIWQRSDLNRAYTGDFEIIGENGVEIFVSVLS